MRDQRTRFDLTQDGLVIGKKLQRIYPDFDVDAFVADVRLEMEGQTLYNVINAIGRVLRDHLSQDYSEALSIMNSFPTTNWRNLTSGSVTVAKSFC